MDDRREGPDPRPPAESEPPPSVAVTWTGSRYRIVDPQLAITVEDADLAEGYAKLRRLRADVVRSLSNAGIPLPDVFGEPATSAPPRPRAAAFSISAWKPKQSAFRKLILKLVLVGVGIVLGYQLLIAPILQRIDRVTALIQNVDPYANTRQASRALAKVADLVQQITPERKKELRQNLRIIVRELRPLTLELTPLFDPGASVPAAQATTGPPSARDPAGEPAFQTLPDPARTIQP